MIDLLRRLFAPAVTQISDPDATLALAALLVRLAKADGLYSAEEMERIEKILMLRNKLDPFAAAALRIEAEEIEIAAPDTVRFTRAIKEAVDLEQRVGLVQSLWSVALADGLRDAGEDQMMRMLASLLGVSDMESAQARSKAQQE
jgi:uncharacterized tellurite resistance protein B-like protein